MRSTFVAAATDSYESLHRVINKLTKAELYEALTLEASTRRRASLIGRLISRLVRVEGQEVKDRLIREYLHGTN